MGVSSACHLLYVRSKNVCKVLTCIDLWGICILFLGSCYPYITFKYACGPFVKWRYIFTTVLTVMTAMCMWASV